MQDSQQIKLTLAEEISNTDILASGSRTSLSRLFAFLARGFALALTLALLTWLRKEELDITRTSPMTSHLGRLRQRGSISTRGQTSDSLHSVNILSLLVLLDDMCGPNSQSL